MPRCSVYYLLLCFYFFSPLAIQITCIILSIIIGIIIIIGISIIPFHIDSNLYKYFFLLNIIFIIIIISINIIFFIIRRLNLMNKYNLCGYATSVVEIYVSFFGFITNMLNGIMILHNIGYYQKVLNEKNPKKFPKLSDEEIIYSKIIIALIIFIWINLILLSFTDNLIINLGVEGSYYNYNLSREIEKDITLEEKKKKKNKKFKVSTIKIKNNNIKAIKESCININNITETQNNDFSNIKASIVEGNNDIIKNLGANEEKKI